MAPQFKKLTDCPENLREAIDWLIQVRHGGDKTGLGKLAEALKKLIEEAISKADKSLDDRKEQLECPPKYWEPGSYCDKKNKDIDGKRKEIDEAKENSEKSKKETELSKLQSEIDKHYNADHYLSEDAREKALKDIEERRKQLADLKDKLTGFTNEEECKNLLTNLCTGLETFLGFNSTSKGYDGTGIVYSDLDRLCDAVMAFLHGVLESVKEDESVQHFDDLIAKELKRDNINMVVSYVSSRLHAGMSGFKENVTHVKQGIEGYLKKVNDLTNGVVGDLPNGTLMKLKKQIGNNILAVGELSKKSLDGVVTTMGPKVYAGLDGSLKKVDDAIKNFDAPLRNKLSNDFVRILVEVEHIKKNAQGDRWRMEKLCENVNKVFYRLQNSIDANIKQNMDKIEAVLINSLQDIQVQVKAIHELLKQYVEVLGEWIHKADEILTEALSNIEKVIEGIKDDYKSKKTAITKTATAMRSKADILHNGYDKAKEQVKEKVAAAVEKITALEQVYKDKLNAIKRQIDAKVSVATSDLMGLKKEVTKGFTALENRINPEVEKVVDALKNAVKKAAQADNRAIELIQDFRDGLKEVDIENPGSTMLYKWANGIRENSGGFKDVLESLNDQCGQFQKFQAVLSAVESLNINGKTFFDSVKEDLRKQVQGALNKLKSPDIEFQKVFNSFHTQITGATGGDEETMHKKIQMIQTQFEKNDFDRNVAGTWEIKDSSMNQLATQQRNLSGAINDVNKAFEVVDNTIKGDFIMRNVTFQNLLDGITGELQRIAQIVTNDIVGADATNAGIKQILKDLKENKILGRDGTNQLQKIKNDIDTLREGKIISLDKTVTTLLNETLPKTIKDYKSAIQSHIYDEVGNAKSAIKRDALNRYVACKLLELEALRKFVDERHESMKHIIKNDMKTGIKGFLKSMSGNSAEDHKTHIKQPDLLTNLQNVVSSIPDNSQPSETFIALSKKLINYLEFINRYVQFDIVQNFDAESTVSAKYSATVNSIKIQLDDLLTHITNSKHFDLAVPGKLEKLKKSVQEFTSSKFGNAAYPVLDTFPQSLVPLVQELQTAYVSRYSGATIRWDELLSSKNTEEAKHCAKVCLTVFAILKTSLNNVKVKCDASNNSKIHVKSELGEFLKTCGFNVSDKKQQNGELRNSENMKGSHILTKLTGTVVSSSVITNLIQTIDTLFTNVEHYNEVCHLMHADSPRSPCSIYEMLCWLSGLTYNRVYGTLRVFCQNLFPTPRTVELHDSSKYVIKAYPTDITAENIEGTLYYVTRYARILLTTILGHGHANGIYACEFSNNALKLSYPPNPEACFDILVEILYRLHHQLYFLYVQCARTYDANSWRDCWYGKDVGGSSWECNTLQCPEQTCNRNCVEHYRCGIKSPLQSFLEDGLKGFLPHQVTKVGCGITCTISNHKGFPCKTPMGFNEIATLASHRKTGGHLMKVLCELCGDSEKPLSKLCSQLKCLLPRPPQSLDDMFAFYYNFLYEWNGKGKGEDHGKLHKKDAFNEKVKQASFGLYDYLDMTPLFKSGDHNNSHNKGDLFSLVCSSTSTVKCGRYMRPINMDINVVYYSKNAGLYLSWMVYLTETFYELLEQLWNECSKNCDTPGSRCYETTCYKNCVATHSSIHSEACSSIASCPLTRPTLCKYGFVLSSLSNLSGSADVKDKRTCSDLCKVLGNTVNIGNVLHTLAYVTIPKFLFDIRAPFFYTTVALWLLSLLYLLHIMVIRLDLLHIKSHLRSPSSHRIAAQSLLAAARVGKLAKLTYLQA